MSTRMGEVKQGAAYGVRVTADNKNKGSTFVFVRWIPGSGHGEPRTYPMRLRPGETQEHKLSAPAFPQYWVIEVELDVPGQDGKAQLYFTDDSGTPRDFLVSRDGVYWAEITA